MWGLGKEWPVRVGSGDGGGSGRGGGWRMGVGGGGSSHDDKDELRKEGTERDPGGGFIVISRSFRASFGKYNAFYILRSSIASNELSSMHVCKNLAVLSHVKHSGEREDQKPVWVGLHCQA